MTSVMPLPVGEPGIYHPLLAGQERTVDADELLQEILQVPREALITLPDSRVVQRPGWFQLLTPSLPRGGLNEVVCTSLPDADAEPIIAATLAEYRRHAIQFRWSIPPGPGAEALATRLARHGLRQESCRAMCRSTEPVTLRAGHPIVSTASVEAFTEVMARGWQSDPGPMRVLHTAMLADPEQRYRFYVAEQGGQALGAAAAVFLRRSVYLMGAVVLEEARGRGAYGALVEARIRDAKSGGRSVATSLARESSSAPILEHLGFQTAASLVVFRSVAPT